MRDDILVDVVLERCDALRKSTFWPGGNEIKPEKWLGNFENEDKRIAALLLDRFVFYSESATDHLLTSAWHSILDGGRKSGSKVDPTVLEGSLNNVVFAPVEGETPNPTDSGNFMCRKARQVLGVDEDRIVTTREALECAKGGTTVVFLDDFVGSGDQFISTWTREYNGYSFNSTKLDNGFSAIYVNLITTYMGLERIFDEAPSVVVSPAHVLNSRSTIFGLIEEGVFDKAEITRFLLKYSVNLRPEEDYISDYLPYKNWGYKRLGLLLGFKHSIPDATLPIFWSPGIAGWEPLIERL